MTKKESSTAVTRRDGAGLMKPIRLFGVGPSVTVHKRRRPDMNMTKMEISTAVRSRDGAGLMKPIRLFGVGPSGTVDKRRRPDMTMTKMEKKTSVRRRDGAGSMKTIRLFGVIVRTSGTVEKRRRQDLASVYRLGEELGRGTFGITHLCEHKGTGELYACKSIAKGAMEQEDMEAVQREVQIMDRLAAQENIVKLKAVYEDKDFIHLVMELCVGGELYSRVCERRYYGEREAASLCRRIVEGVQACHSAGVMHRDLKLDNILFATEEEDSPIKLIDFGLSVLFEEDEVFEEVVGTPGFMAPEVYTKHYGKEADLWSAGAILYTLLCGAYPFGSSAGRDAVRDAVLHDEVKFDCYPWPKISNGAKDLVKQMLERDPRKRLTADGVLSHPWIRESTELDRASRS